MIYAAIDTETTGLDKKRCALLELAIVLEDTSARPLPPVEELPYFHSLVDLSDGAHWELPAIQMHVVNGLLDELDSDNPLPSAAQVAVNAREFLAQHGHHKRFGLTPAGKNYAGFDHFFLPEHLAEMFHHRALDPGSVFVDFKREKLPGLNDLLSYERGARPPHRALEDARDIVRVLRRRYAA